MRERQKRSIEEWADLLIVPLYQEQYLQTLWNAYDRSKRENGWRLKNKQWSPWFYNMRPFGDSPKLFHNTSLAMADLVAAYDVNLLIGVEMAGIPLVGAVSVASLAYNGIEKRIGYTRPLPEKARTPLEALEILRKIAAEPTEKYGEKSYVEARLRNGDRVGIFDDMANDLGSKIIARLVVLWQASQMSEPVQITCNKAFYTLNRNVGNRQKGLDFANNSNPDLYPEPIEVHYLIETDEHLCKLERVMKPDEFQVFSAYQKDPNQFQDYDVQREILALAARSN